MKLSNIVKILHIGAIALVMTGCGGGSSSGGGGSTTQPPSDQAPIVVTSPFDTVQELHDGETISVGVYNGIGVNYYDLILPEFGNIQIDIHGSFADVVLYDENMNQLKNTYWGYHKLDAGTYLLKVKYYGYPLTINSNILYNQSNLPVIASGTYTETAKRARKFYKMILPSDGNIDIDIHGSFADVVLYDINLNKLEDTYWGSHKLEAGTYILGVKYDGQPLTIKSNVF